jgi:hypothetical protein
MKHHFVGCLCLLSGLAVATADDKSNEVRTPPTRIWHGNIDGVRDQRNLPSTGPIANIWGTQASTAFVTNRQDLQKLWQALRRNDRLPDIDFAKEALIVTPQRATQMMIVETGDKAVLAFSTARPMGTGQAYSIAVFPKTSVTAVIRGSR